MAGESTREAVFEFSRMAVEHTHVLFTIAAGLAVIEILMIAHILSERGTHVQQAGDSYSFHFIHARINLPFLLELSVYFSAASLVFGYFSDAVLLKSIERYAGNGEWNAPTLAEILNYFQMVSILFAIIFLAIAFKIFSSRVSSLFLKVHDPKKPGGG